jgi:hypothetical protein
MYNFPIAPHTEPLHERLAASIATSLAIRLGQIPTPKSLTDCTTDNAHAAADGTVLHATGQGLFKR